MVTVMHIMSEEKVELVAYQLKGVTTIWYEQWVDKRGRRASPIGCEEFKYALLDQFLPIKLREVMVQEFIILMQGTISLREYGLKLTKLSKYALFMVANLRAHMSTFILSVFELVSKDCKMAMLVKQVDISRLMMYVEPIEEEKFCEKTRESKRARVEGGNYSP